ncbi:hypothetical protein IFM89_025941 [Coptis chinensis]|uniref:5'-3' DNA helicase ZGRF1-like N-terminal domain-containing protein n=1 Tax=Coptis chinensis TaxID=261450 RepID=A0A835LWQ1_9MAGN|nr:hypothetical protein IFM89_025941 [Coptis chinensis]
MEELKKWTVTYTKHLKQKRKLYQDGVLQLHCSNGTHKFYLYDENGMVIDSRFLKKGEAVECGKTLNFSGYLVDILDIEDKSKPLLSDLKNVQEMVKKPRQKFGTLHGTELKPSPLKHFEVKVKEEEKEKTTEWHVLYTTQKTQKAKKYHDGILRLVVGLSHTKQVFLYDDRDKLLESRFLKKDEVVRYGETLTFEGYLVDIGNLEENCQPIPDSNVQGRVKRSIENFGRLNGKNAGNSSSSVASKSSGLGKNVEPDKQPNANNKREWVALYTAQKTQKAKKFHDGVLRLSVGVCQRKQFYLYDENGMAIDSRFLKKGEAVECGKTLNFSGYLVDILDIEDKSKPLLSDLKNVQEMVKKPRQKFGTLHEWVALYTTQKTQKAKKFHDGVLRLSVGVCQRKQVTLLSDDGTILSSKYLKSSEDVKSCSTMELTAHLVEIGEERTYQEVPFAGEIQSDNTSSRGVASDSSISHIDRINLNGSSSSVGRVNGLGNNVAPGNRPSVAHNIKSESVNGLVNSVAPGNHPSVAHNVKSESEHNGLGNNAAPENRPSLTNNVRSLRTGMTSCSCLLGLYFDISQMNAEWHALYTTQKTQKTKRYHDGFLRLSVGVSQRKQVTLLSKDGTFLSSKYLSFSEDVRTGSKLELTGHLVEIGEAILLEGGDIQNANSLGASLASCPTISTVDRMKLNSSDRRNKTKSYGPPNNTSSGKDLGLYPKSSNVDKDKFSQSGTRTDLIYVMPTKSYSLLKGQWRAFPAKEAIVQQVGSSQDSDLGEFGNQDLLGQDVFKPNLMRRSVIHIPDGNPENYNVSSNAQVVTEISQSECFEKLPASGPHNGGVDLPLPSLVGSDSCPEDPERKNCKELKSKGKEQVDKNEFPSFDLGF